MKKGLWYEAMNTLESLDKSQETTNNEAIPFGQGEANDGRVITNNLEAQYPTLSIEQRSARIAEIEEELERLGNVGAEILDGLPDDVRESTTELLTEIFESDSPMEYADDKTMSQFVPLILEAKKLEDELQFYDKQVLIETSELLTNEFSDFTARIDFNALLVHLYDTPLVERPYELSGLQSALQELSRIEELMIDVNSGEFDSSLASSLLARVRSIVIEYENAGLLSDIPHRNFNVSALPSGEVIRNTAIEIVDVARRYSNFKYYKGSDVIDFPNDRFLSDIGSSESSPSSRALGINSNNVATKDNYLSRFRSAVCSRITATHDRWKNSGILPEDPASMGVEHQRVLAELNVGELIENLSISGFEERLGFKTALTAEELRHMIGWYIPPCVVRDVKIVEASDLRPKEKRTRADGSEYTATTMGRRMVANGEDNQREVVIILFADVRVPDDSPDNLTDGTKVIALETMFHEFGHELWDDLDFYEFDAWERVVREESNPISEYAIISREKSYTLGLEEDFCICYAMLMMRPFSLLVIRPEVINEQIISVDGTPERAKRIADYIRRRTTREQWEKINNYISTRFSNEQTALIELAELTKSAAQESEK